MFYENWEIDEGAQAWFAWLKYLPPRLKRKARFEYYLARYWEWRKGERGW